MAKVRIYKSDGTPTRYFYWSKGSEDAPDLTDIPVYKHATDGVKRMRGVRFNAETNRMRKT